LEKGYGLILICDIALDIVQKYASAGANLRGKLGECCKRAIILTGNIEAS
jgi:hypothetical protein